MKKGKVAVSFWIRKDIADNVDYLAQRVCNTKSCLLANVVSAVVHDMMIDYEKRGVLILNKRVGVDSE